MGGLWHCFSHITHRFSFAGSHAPDAPLLLIQPKNLPGVHYILSCSVSGLKSGNPALKSDYCSRFLNSLAVFLEWWIEMVSIGPLKSVATFRMQYPCFRSTGGGSDSLFMTCRGWRSEAFPNHSEALMVAAQLLKTSVLCAEGPGELTSQELTMALENYEATSGSCLGCGFSRQCIVDRIMWKECSSAMCTRNIQKR